jgi:opacity protein-like surface antigen
MKTHLILAAAGLLALAAPAFAADDMQNNTVAAQHMKTARSDDGYQGNDRENVIVNNGRYSDNHNLGATGDLQHNGRSYNPGVAEHY